MSILGGLLMAAGGLLLLIAAWGVQILPDVLARQHAATKAGTLAVAVFSVGAILMAGDWAFTWRLVLIIAFLLVTLPVGSHLLARSAVREGGWSKTVKGLKTVNPNYGKKG